MSLHGRTGQVFLQLFSEYIKFRFLVLLERAFLRIGSAESDDQFEALIDKLLGPIIFKVPSTHESVRKKVSL